MIRNIVVARKHASSVGTDAELMQNALFRRISGNRFQVGENVAGTNTLQVETRGGIGTLRLQFAIQTAVRRTFRAVFLAEKHQRTE